MVFETNFNKEMICFDIDRRSLSYVVTETLTTNELKKINKIK